MDVLLTAKDLKSGCGLGRNEGGGEGSFILFILIYFDLRVVGTGFD